MVGPNVRLVWMLVGLGLMGFLIGEPPVLRPSTCLPVSQPTVPLLTKEELHQLFHRPGKATDRFVTTPSGFLVEERQPSRMMKMRMEASSNFLEQLYREAPDPKKPETK